MGLISYLRGVFERSSVVHVRRRAPENAHDLIELFDRFLDRRPRYDLEWDDFISWTSDNIQVEAARNAIGVHEPLLFSKDPGEKLKYRNYVIEERNKLAALLNLPTRAPMDKLPKVGGGRS